MHPPGQPWAQLQLGPFSLTPGGLAIIYTGCLAEQQKGLCGWHEARGARNLLIAQGKKSDETAPARAAVH